MTVRYGCELVAFGQDAGIRFAPGQDATGRDADDHGALSRRLRRRRSFVRRELGIALSGEANLLQLRQALFRCDDLYDRIPIGKGRHYHVADGQSTFLIVQDSTRHFTLHSVVETDADMARMFERTCAMPVDYEMLYVGQWRQNLLLADRYARAARLSRRRCGASHDPDRRARHEYRRR